MPKKFHSISFSIVLTFKNQCFSQHFHFCITFIKESKQSIIEHYNNCTNTTLHRDGITIEPELVAGTEHNCTKTQNVYWLIHKRPVWVYDNSVRV